MTLIEICAKTALLIRISEWHDKALSVVVCILIVVWFEPESSQHISLISVVGIFTISLGIYGYSLNAYCDRAQDKKIGKNYIVATFNESEFLSVIGLSASCSLVALLFIDNTTSVLIGLLTFMLATVYSARPIRLKERGWIGIIVGAVTQRLLPFLIFVATLDTQTLVTGFLGGWLTILGISTMGAHQLLDYENDEITGCSTWARDVGLHGALIATTSITALFVAYTFIIIPLETVEKGVLITIVLLLLSTKQIIWIGEILLKCANAVRYKNHEETTRKSESTTAQPGFDAISKGRSYLLNRLREGDLATRAPDSCPHRNWDWKGVPYLSLNVVVALEGYMSATERLNLATSILQVQKNGAWDYTNGGRGVDIDTTASAIRALDRLGHTVNLAGVFSFYDAETRLFSTFKAPGVFQGLCLPPQNRDRHFGAHPCVLPNVWLLLQERDQLPTIAKDCLTKMQSDNGLWPSYFYLSPYYSTRLYAELLTARKEDYTTLLNQTFRSLMECELPDCPTQIAEITLSLNSLQTPFAERSNDIQAKIDCNIDVLKSFQHKDGSWPGSNIWTFMHRTHPEPVVGYDCFKVHSTALCVQALSINAL